ncbi:MAG: ATP-binding protein [Candidatus Cloacimonetes bacterium]|nr:ATP-binding protein [Candidatus Cloacimonadota bacterium]
MRHFNTAGPVNQPDAYKIDPLTRWDTEEILELIQEKKYFILHAPRQTGKTSCLLALRDYLNKEGKYFAVYVNFEVGQAWRHNIKKATDDIVQEILSRMHGLLWDEFAIDESIAYYKTRASENALSEMLRYLSLLLKKPIVMFIDEIDSLIGDTLLSVLRQLRAGYDKRPSEFPSTIILCGVRDIKDYRIHTSNQEIITGGSAFNIKTKSLRLGNFSKEEVIELYNQHTRETCQVFAEECFDLVMEYTDGQPWLVNALAREVTHEMKENRDRSITITTEKLEIAKERLILARQTHLDQLADKLDEPRVRNVILPMVLSIDSIPNKDDAQYCIDLGLLKSAKTGLEIANKIYKEVIPRTLTEDTQSTLPRRFDPDWINDDDSINVQELLRQFKEFWNENTAIWASSIKGYQEAAPHLVFQAFLQRMLNGGGIINREYALGNRRTDIMIKRTYKKNDTYHTEKIVIELKVINNKQKYESIRDEAIMQTSDYAKICGVHEAQIIIFDRNETQKWTADEPNEYAEHDGVKLVIWKLGTGVW